MKHSLISAVLILQQVLLIQLSFSQTPLTARKVDEYSAGTSQVSVYFYDQLDWLQKNDPSFIQGSDEQRWRRFDSTSLHARVYAFVVSGEDGGSTTYVARGNPAKTNTAVRYQLEIINGNAVQDEALYPSAIIQKFGLRGEVFEHAAFLSRKPFKGQQAVQLFGMFTAVTAYSNVKKLFNDFMARKEELIAEYIRTRDQARIQPLFAYQSCAVLQVKSRTFQIAVNRTDQFGKPQQDVREEYSDSLYLAAIDENDLLGVTALPYFAATDTLVPTARPDSLLVRTSMPYLHEYLKDIYIIRSSETGQVTGIGGTLLIHGYSAEGHSVHEEIYRAKLAPVGNCVLPVTINYYHADDGLLLHPRLQINVSYAFRE